MFGSVCDLLKSAVRNMGYALVFLAVLPVVIPLLSVGNMPREADEQREAAEEMLYRWLAFILQAAINGIMYAALAFLSWTWIRPDSEITWRPVFMLACWSLLCGSLALSGWHFQRGIKRDIKEGTYGLTLEERERAWMERRGLEL